MRKESFYTIINDFSGFAEGRGKLHGVGREAGAFRRFHPFSSAKKAIPPLRQPPVPPLLFSFPGVDRLVSGSGEPGRLGAFQLGLVVRLRPLCPGLDFGVGVPSTGPAVGSKGASTSGRIYRRIVTGSGGRRGREKPLTPRPSSRPGDVFFRPKALDRIRCIISEQEDWAMNLTHLIFLAAILVGILIITHWAAKTNTTPQQFYIVSGNLTATQNGLAIAGDFISAASFLGITGSIALYGFDGFLYAIGFLVSYLLLLFFIAEPIRRLGTYTVGDVIAARFPERPIRLIVSLNTLLICVLYMVPQLMAAGLFIQLLLGLDYPLSVLVIGLLITVYVMFGGMITTSWVQIIKTVLLMTGTFLLCLLVFARFEWDPPALLAQVVEQSPYAEGFFRSGNLLHHPWEAFSLLLTLILGTAGLPHILIRFYTVHDQTAVRQSVVIASWIIGAFYLMTLNLGLGAVALVGFDRLVTADPEGNLAAPLLAYTLGGDFV